MSLDLQSLRLFVAVCEEGSINRAAARENIALSALSRRISDLEVTLSLTLLRRHSRGVHPTGAGLSLLQHANIILRDVGQLAAELAGPSGGVHGTVRLHANTWAITEYVPGHVGAFLAANPSLNVEIEEAVTVDTIRAVRDGGADLGIVISGTGGEGLRLLPYAADRLIVMIPQGHALAAGGPLRLPEVAGHDVIAPCRGSALEALVMAAIAELGLVLRIRARISGFETLSRMVQAGLGIGFAPARTAARLGPPLGLVLRELAEPWAVRRLSICLPLSPLPPPVQLLADHLVRIGAGSNPGFATGEGSLPEKAYLAERDCASVDDNGATTPAEDTTHVGR